MQNGGDFIYPIVSGLFGAGATYGFMRAKIVDMEKLFAAHCDTCAENHKKLDHELEIREARWVTKDTFNAVIGPMAHTLEELQRDVKKILTLVSRQSD